ncbi:hypothetical protein ACQP1P_33175 [Dactylosporangium sp. CA-052675]|uniref:hypothetical protein n=1 Tax=Dactylosporangium sp. CA-052675 TaxID=3239927 RepID=UPI003D917041
MNDLEQLSERLHELVGAPASTPPTYRLMERGRRARRRRAALVSASLAVLALGGVASVAVANHANRPIDRPHAAATVADPGMELVAAIANSQNISFQLKSTATGQKGGGKPTLPADTTVTLSAFDPATATGYLRSANGNFEYRLVNGVLYMANGSQWLQQPGKHDSLNMDEDKLRGEFTASADSQQLFEALRAGDAKVDKTGADTYHFEATRTKDGGTVKFIGDFSVGTDKRIAKVTYDWTLTYSQGGFHKSHVVLEYSGYGEPVTVEVPPNPVLVG